MAVEKKKNKVGRPKSSGSLNTAGRMSLQRKQRSDAGLKEIRNRWAHPDDHDQISRYIEMVNKERARDQEHEKNFGPAPTFT